MTAAYIKLTIIIAVNKNSAGIQYWVAADVPKKKSDFFSDEILSVKLKIMTDTKIADRAC